MNSQNRSGGAQAGGSSASRSSPPPKLAPVPHLTAEQEKAALRRYEEAKMAVDRIQHTNFGGPIAYESLFPAGSSSQAPPPPADEKPPSFDNAVSGPSNIMAMVSEKERLRREYEARDAAALAQQDPPPPAPYSPAPPVPGPSTPAQYANAQEEKEALRKKFEARDAQMAARPSSPPHSPPRANGVSAGDGKSSPRSPNAMTGGSRPPPTPPVSASGHTHILTAAEEKALLKAKYETYGSGRKVTPQASTRKGTSIPTTPPPPPPLMPRPPAEYIKETQEEDARLSQLNGVLDGVTLLNGASSSSPTRQAFKNGQD